jgi:hypothetical protein
MSSPGRKDLNSVPVIVSVLIIDLGRICSVRVCPRLIAVLATVLAIRVHKPIRLVRTASAVWIA